jgi:hypothetical protein
MKDQKKVLMYCYDRAKEFWYKFKIFIEKELNTKVSVYYDESDLEHKITTNQVLDHQVLIPDEVIKELYSDSLTYKTDAYAITCIAHWLYEGLLLKIRETDLANYRLKKKIYDYPIAANFFNYPLLR